MEYYEMNKNMERCKIYRVPSPLEIKLRSEGWIFHTNAFDGDNAVISIKRLEEEGFKVLVSEEAFIMDGSPYEGAVGIYRRK